MYRLLVAPRSAIAPNRQMTILALLNFTFKSTMIPAIVSIPLL